MLHCYGMPGKGSPAKYDPDQKRIYYGQGDGKMLSKMFSGWDREREIESLGRDSGQDQS
jgi:hypothetical protein